MRDGTSWHSTSLKAACKGARIAQCSAAQRGDAAPHQTPAQHPGAGRPDHWPSAQAGPAAVSRSQIPGLLPHSAHPWRHDRGTHACSISCSFWFAYDQQRTVVMQLQDAAAFDGQGLGLTNLQTYLVCVAARLQYIGSTPYNCMNASQHAARLHGPLLSKLSVTSLCWCLLALTQATGGWKPTLPGLQPPTLLCQKSPAAHQACMLANALAPVQKQSRHALCSQPISTTLKTSRQQTCYLLMCTGEPIDTDSDTVHLVALCVSKVTLEGLGSCINTCAVC